MSCHKNETWHKHTQKMCLEKKEPGKRTKFGMLLFELSQARKDFFEVKTRPRRSTWMRENRFSLGELAAIPYTVVEIAF